MPKTCIIGAGITGLAKAWQLYRDGQPVTVLETSDRVGGAMSSIREDGYLCEEGPNSIQLNSHILEDFFQSIPNLDTEILEANDEAKKRFIVRGGIPQAVPMGPLSAISTPLWSLGGKLRVLKEPFIKPRSEDTEESVADFVRRRLGNELYEYAINPLIGGIYAGDPEKLSLKHGFPKLHALEQHHGGLIRGAIAKMKAARRSPGPRVRKRIISFRNGIDTLPKCLATALGSSVSTQVQLRSIEQVGARWKVTWQNKTGESYEETFDQLLLTLPAHAVAKLPLPPELLSKFGELPDIHYPAVSVLSLGYKREQIKHPLDGFGALVPERENRKILGVLFPSSVFKERAPQGSCLLTAFIGGTRNPEFASPDTASVLEHAEPELKALLGITGSPEFIHHRHWAKAIPQYNLGYGKVLSRIKEIEERFEGLQFLGNYRNGISLTNCIESAQVD